MQFLQQQFYNLHNISLRYELQENISYIVGLLLHLTNRMFVLLSTQRMEKSHSSSSHLLRPGRRRCVDFLSFFLFFTVIYFTDIFDHSVVGVLGNLQHILWIFIEGLKDRSSVCVCVCVPVVSLSCLLYVNNHIVQGHLKNVTIEIFFCLWYVLDSLQFNWNVSNI